MNGADQSDCSSCTAVKRSVAFFGIFFQEANHTKLTTPTGKAESKPKKNRSSNWRENTLEIG